MTTPPLRAASTNVDPHSASMALPLTIRVAFPATRSPSDQIASSEMVGIQSRDNGQPGSFL
jgi:hypothetical protein